MLVNNRWVRASGNLQDKPISIQFREDWTNDDSTGFPATEEQARIIAFTEQLQARLEPDENSVVAMMITHDGINQWIIYSKDLDVLKAGLETIPTDNGLYPIEVVADEDAEWSTFIQVHERINSELDNQ
jgi:hypothetical protein